MGVAGLAMQRVARELAEQHPRMQPYGPVFALFMEGNFEAGVLLLDTLWDVSFAKHVREEFVVAVPARDVPSFGDASSAEAIAKLDAITGWVHASGRGGHLLTPTDSAATAWEYGLSLTVSSTPRTGRPELMVASSESSEPYRIIFFSMVLSMDMGRALRGGRLTPSRSWRTSIFNSVMVRLSVLRCMPSSRAARHWLPRFSSSTVRMNRFLNSRTPSE
jgi:hypothetical protein